LRHLESGEVIRTHERLQVAGVPGFPVVDAPDEAVEDTVDDDLAVGDVPVPEAQVRCFDGDLQALRASGAHFASLTGVFDERQTTAAQDLGVDRLAGAQLRDQSLHGRVGLQPEGLCQLVFWLTIHRNIVRLRRVPGAPDCS